MKKRGILSSVFLIVILLNLIIISAELNLKITGTVDDYNSDVRLKTNSNANDGFDAYDMKAPSSPSDYASFYSTVGSDSLTIDSWDSGDGARTLNLIYELSDPLTDTLALDWNIEGIGAAFTAVLKDYGNTAGYSTQVGNDINMRSQSSTTSSLTSDSKNYYTVTITPVAAEEQAADSGGVSGGGGGGGGGAPTKDESLINDYGDIFIGNKFIDVYSGLGQVKSRKIELYNEADKIISGTIRIEGDEISKLIQFEKTSFSLNPKEQMIIPMKIIIGEDMELGIYSGKIIIEDGVHQEIQVTITVSKQDLLFDAGLEIPWDFKIIEQGFNLPVQITLIPMVDNPRFDVRTSYTIKDFEGREFYKDSKTFLIDGTWNEKIEFPTGDLGLVPGKYVLELELEYPYPNVQAVASSKSSFEIRSAGIGNFFDYRVSLLVLGGIIVVLIFISLIVFKKHKSKHKKKKK